MKVFPIVYHPLIRVYQPNSLDNKRLPAPKNVVSHRGLVAQSEVL